MSSEENPQLKSINEKYPLPSYLEPYFASNSLAKVHFARILGPPVKLTVQKENGNLANVYSFVYKDNFAIGALWGLLSGYCSKSFFKPSELKPLPKQNELSPKAMQMMYFFDRTGVISGRVIRRIIIAGLAFDFFEQQFSKEINHSRTNSMSIFGAMAVCALAFRLSNNPLKNTVFTTALLGGYLLGAKLPSAILEEQRRRKDK